MELPLLQVGQASAMVQVTDWKRRLAIKLNKLRDAYLVVLGIEDLYLLTAKVRLLAGVAILGSV
jgi:hypothetical protein